MSSIIAVTEPWILPVLRVFLTIWIGVLGVYLGLIGFYLVGTSLVTASGSRCYVIGTAGIVMAGFGGGFLTVFFLLAAGELPPLF